MAQPSTQDTQKVFQSTLTKFSSFLGGVDKVSSTKHMTDIYDNMAKLFEAFTKGVLTEQGANSEIILRQIYRSLNKDFLDIIEDSDAVDKIIDVIKSNQDKVNPDKVDSAPVSETTKKVVTNTLEPNNCDLMQVVLDFIDELQTDILQVKLNLSREYEQRKIYQSKSIEGQKEDIERLNVSFQKQSEEMVDSLQEFKEVEDVEQDENVQKMQVLLNKFNGIKGEVGPHTYLKELDDIVKADKELNKFIKQSQYNVKELVANIKSAGEHLKKVHGQKPSSGSGAMPLSKGGGSSQGQETSGQDAKKLSKMNTLLKDSQKLAGDVDKQSKDKGMKRLMTQKSNDRKLASAPKKSDGASPQKGNAATKGSKIANKPNMSFLPKKSPKQSSIDKNGVLEALGRMNSNLSKTLGKPKFKKGLSINFNPIQNQIKKLNKKADKGEAEIKGDLDKTKDGIGKLKSKARRNLVQKFIFGGGPMGILFTVVGGLLLIGMIRTMWKSWKEQYMPETDPTTYTFFGIPIPGFGTIKAFGIGIYNYVTVGLPNHFRKLKSFLGNVYEEFFGKKGCIRSVGMLQITIWKIIRAWIIGKTKKIGGWLVSLLGKALKLIPGWGTVAGFIIEFAPAIYTFIATQMSNAWGNKKEVDLNVADLAAQAQKRAKKKTIRMLRRRLTRSTRKIRPFVPMESFPGLMTPRWDSSSMNSARPKKKAIFARGTHVKSRFKTVKTEEKLKQQMMFSQQMRAKIQTFSEDELEQLRRTYKLKFSEFKDKYPWSFDTWYQAVHDEEQSRLYYNFINYVAKSESYKYHAIELYKWALRQTIETELEANWLWPRQRGINAYIEKLKEARKKRFEGIKYVWNPKVGWNPGLILKQDDLKSRLNVFDLNRDVILDKPYFLGKPTKEVMTFTLGEGGVPRTYDPYAFEIARATLAIKLMESLINDMKENMTDPTYTLHDTHMIGTNDVTTGESSKFRWRGVEWGGHSTQDLFPATCKLNRAFISEFSSDLSHDRYNLARTYDFGKSDQTQLARWQAGQDEELLNADYFQLVDKHWQSKGFLKRQKQMEANDLASGRIAVLWRDLEPPRESAVLKGFQYAADFVKDPFRQKEEKPELTTPKKSQDEIDEEVKDHVKELKKGTKIGKSILDKKRGLFGISFWRMMKFEQQTDAISRLTKPSILGPMSLAANLVDYLFNTGIWPFRDIGDVSTGLNNMGPLVYLASLLLRTRYKMDEEAWKTFQSGHDTALPAAISRSFLEYLYYSFVPNWRKAMRLFTLINADGYEIQEHDFENLDKTLDLLVDIFDQDAVTSFLFEHIRFPNANIRIIDYTTPGITDEDIETLDVMRKNLGLKTPKEKTKFLKTLEGVLNRFDNMGNSQSRKKWLLELSEEIDNAEYEAKYTGDKTYLRELVDFYRSFWAIYKKHSNAEDSESPVRMSLLGETPVLDNKSPEQKRQEKENKRMEELKKREEQQKKEAEEAQQRLKEAAARKERIKQLEIENAAKEKIRNEEYAYERLLARLVDAPHLVSEQDLKEIGDRVKDLKQEAENRISKLPRQERDLKLALIRGDSLSPKTFTEIKETSIGLHGSLQKYIEEVNKIPSSSVIAVNNMGSGRKSVPIYQVDPDRIDMAS